jgi:omega-hydroxy-beta-dihydromenaquinone-9 sulfotransferase
MVISGLWQPGEPIVYFNLKLFFKALRLSLFASPFRFRRAAYVLGFTGLFGVMWVIVAVGRMMDHLLFPGFRKQPVKSPVFIIAPPRSGTTFLQKLMALDEERFVHAKLYQTIFPCISYQRLILLLARLDGWCGSPLRKGMEFCERRFFGGWDDKHKMRFDQPEEDDGFFVYTFVTEAIFLLFPYVHELWVAGFADDLPAEDRRRLMRYYRSCLQRQLYIGGRDKVILSKATQSCGSIRCLLEEFPDARFITLLRHPYQSVASHVSVFYPVWKAHSPEMAKDSPVSHAYASLAIAWYRHVHEMRSFIAPSNFHCVDYKQFIADPCRTLEEVYRHFDLAMTDSYRQRLAGEVNREKKFKSAHHYTLEEFGLSKEWVRGELTELFRDYGLE